MNHGEWLPMLKDIGIDQATARMLMQIGRNPAISNRCNSNDFPAALRSLYELSRLDPSSMSDGSRRVNAEKPAKTRNESRP